MFSRRRQEAQKVIAKHKAQAHAANSKKALELHAEKSAQPVAKSAEAVADGSNKQRAK